MSKEYSTDEVREQFLRNVNDIVKFWHGVEDHTELEKLDGVAFSIMATLDGCAIGLPSFIVAPRPHETDKEFHQDEGSDWYPENHEVEDDVNCVISGCLHELLGKYE